MYTVVSTMAGCSLAENKEKKKRAITSPTSEKAMVRRSPGPNKVMSKPTNYISSFGAC
jgi:hypothetical protein